MTEKSFKNVNFEMIYTKKNFFLLTNIGTIDLMKLCLNILSLYFSLNHICMPMIIDQKFLLLINFSPSIIDIRIEKICLFSFINQIKSIR